MLASRLLLPGNTHEVTAGNSVSTTALKTAGTAIY